MTAEELQRFLFGSGERAAEATSTASSPEWEDFWKQQGIVTVPGTVTERIVPEAIPELAGLRAGIKVIPPRPTIVTTKAEEVKRAGFDAATQQATEDPLKISTESPSAAGMKLGFKDVTEGVSKIGQVVGLISPPSFGERARALAERKRLEEEATGALGMTGRVASQLALGALPGGLAVNAAAKAALPAGLGAFVRGRAGQNALTQGASMATQGALQGGTAAALTSGQSQRPLVEQVLEGAATGGILGGGLGVAAPTLTRTGVGQVDPEAARLGYLAVNKYGMESLRPPHLSATESFPRKLDQITGQLPLSGASHQNTLLRKEYTKAVLDTAGIKSHRITPEALSTRRSDLGKVLEHVETNYDVNLANVFNDFADIEYRLVTQLPDEGQKKVLKHILDNIYSNLQPGDTIPGKTFGILLHKNSKSGLQAAIDGKDPDISRFAREIKDTLQDALQQSVPQDIAELYGHTRGQYRNLMTIAGARESGGYLTPMALDEAIIRNVGGRQKNAFYKGGDLKELAEIGKRFLVEPRDSGTPFGHSIQNMLSYPGNLLGTMALGTGGAYGLYAGMPFGLPNEALLSVPATVALSRMLRVPMNSRLLRDSAINSTLGLPVNPLISYGGRTVAPNLLGSQTVPMLSPPQKNTPE